MAEFDEGDRVTVLREYRDGVGRVNGQVGELVSMDSHDPEFPYLVRLTDGTVWVHEVRRSGEDVAQAGGREALVTRAKELLTGIAHTGADVVAMAAFLAGG